MKKVVGYVRVSTEEQVSGSSLDDQKARIQKYANFHELELSEIYCDGGISGGSLNRPELTKLLKDAKEKKFEALLFTKLDRLGRSVRDIFNLYHEFQELSIEIISTEDPAINTTGPMGKALIGMLAVFAEFERSLIRERTDIGRKNKWRNMESVIGSLPFGYRRSKTDGQLIEIDADQAEIYKRIIDLYLTKRMSTRLIAETLNTEGIPSPSVGRRKKPTSGIWDHTVILDILKNPTYKGEAILNKKKFVCANGKNGKSYYCAGNEDKPENEWIKIPFPALIDDDRWRQIQNRRENQRLKPKRVFHEYDEHFMLDGLLYCGECGTKIRKKVQEEKNGTIHLYYFCWASWASPRDLGKREKCHLKAVNADHVDREVFDGIADVLSNPSKYIDVWAKDIELEDVKKKIEALQKREKDIDSQLKVGFDFIRRTIDPDSRKLYMEQQNKTQKNRDDIHRELTNAQESLAIISGKAKRMEDFRNLFKSRINTKLKLKDFLYSLDFKEKKAIVETMISPENGGNVKISYITPVDFMTPEEMEGMSKEERILPLKNERVAVKANFQIDPGKIADIISGLNRENVFLGGQFSPNPQKNNNGVNADNVILGNQSWMNCRNSEEMFWKL